MTNPRTAWLDSEEIAHCGHCTDVLGVSGSNTAVRQHGGRLYLPAGIMETKRGYMFTRHSLARLRHGRSPRFRRAVVTDGTSVQPSRPLLDVELPTWFCCPWCGSWNELSSALPTTPK